MSGLGAQRCAGSSETGGYPQLSVFAMSSGVLLLLPCYCRCCCKVVQSCTSPMSLDRLMLHCVGQLMCVVAQLTQHAQPLLP
jgi:hypothetical protein